MFPALARAVARGQPLVGHRVYPLARVERVAPGTEVPHPRQQVQQFLVVFPLVAQVGV